MCFAGPVSLTVDRIGKMDDRPALQHLEANGPGLRLLRVVRQEFGIPRRNAARRRSREAPPVIGPQDAECRAAQMHGFVQHCVKYRREIAG